MRCIEPVRISIRENGKVIDYIYVPCGHCPACNELYKSDWAVRAQLELAGHNKACMVTLTFSDEGLAKHNQLYPDHVNSVEKRELQLFLKRLRKDLGNQKIRFVGVGEYGEQFGRPHYHLLIYGIDADNPVFDGKIPVIRKGRVDHYYIFNGINSWQYGQVEVNAGKVDGLAVAYMLKYFAKERDKKSIEQYERENRHPMFMLLSRRPGLGFYGIKKFAKTLFHKGYATLGSRKIHLSRYIVDKLEDIFSEIDVREDLKLRSLEYLHNHKQNFNLKQWLINERSKNRK